MVAEEQSGKMVSAMEVCTKQSCVIESLQRIAPVDIQLQLLNVYGDQTVDVGTVM
jgi:hypothetical protein